MMYFFKQFIKMRFEMIFILFMILLLVEIVNVYIIFILM
jgi:hypothetical protein